MIQRNLSFRQERGLLVVAGLMLGLSFPPTGFAGGLLAFFALVPLLIAIESATRLRETFRRSFLAMFVFGLVATYWVGGWKGIGDVDPFLMIGGLILLIIHPFFLVIPVLLYDVARRRWGSRAALILLPFFWGGFEYWHSLGDLSFPWLSLANTQTYNLYYIQWIEYVGPYALSMAIVAINVLLYALLWRPAQLNDHLAQMNDHPGMMGHPRPLGDRRRPRMIAHPRVALIGCLAALVVLPYLHGALVMGAEEAHSGKIRVAVIQPNLNPWAKWEVSREAVLDSNFRATDLALEGDDHLDLLLWPETAITFPITLDREAYYLSYLYEYVQKHGAPLITGFPDYELYQVGGSFADERSSAAARDALPIDAKPTEQEGIAYRSWNAAMLLYQDDSGAFHRETYHKQKLVPLGEQVPFADVIPVLGRWFRWSVGLGSWNKGTGVESMKLPMAALPKATMPNADIRSAERSSEDDTAKIWTMICYESIYPSFVREFVKHGAQMLAVITNDGWYGKSSGPHQHNQFAVLRAIENRRWIARSANTGISSFIDDRGRFVEQTPLFEKAWIAADVPLNDRITLYTDWGDVVALPALFFTLAATIYFMAAGWRERRRGKGGVSRL